MNKTKTLIVITPILVLITVSTALFAKTNTVSRVPQDSSSTPNYTTPITLAPTNTPEATLPMSVVNERVQQAYKLGFDAGVRAAELVRVSEEHDAHVQKCWAIATGK